MPKMHRERIEYSIEVIDAALSQHLEELSGEHAPPFKHYRSLPHPATIEYRLSQPQVLDQFHLLDLTDLGCIKLRILGENATEIRFIESSLRNKTD